MILSTTVPIKWNSKNKSRYVSLGYQFTKMQDEFEVKLSDLSTGSHALVKFRCDYCGAEYTQQWSTYNKLFKNPKVHKHCCGNPKCTGKKSSEAIFEKYGVYNTAYIHESIQKRKLTNLNRYGAENVFASPIIKDRIIETCHQKYGCSYAMQSPMIQEKVKNTCLKKYGVEYYLGLNYGVGKLIGDKNPRWNPNRTDATRIHERRTYDYAQWRKSVFERDGFVCVKCGLKGIKYGGNCKSNGLNAHHIENYATHKSRRYDITNGITLCNQCHTSFHKRYGYYNNTESQLLEFLNHDKNIC